MKIEKPREKVKYWLLPRLGNLELLHATYLNHSFSKHTHDGYAIGVIEEGALKFSYRGKNIIAPEGHINLVVPGEAHDGYAASENGWTYRMFYLQPGLLSKAASEIAGRPQGLPFFKAGAIKDVYMARMICQLHLLLEKQCIPLIEQESRLLSVLTHFILRYADFQPALKKTGKENLAVSRAQDYIESNYSRDISVEDLSRVANLSPFHLIRVFSDELGVPPHAYLTQVRIRRAKELITRGLPLVQTAFETGFVDQSHLTKSFKRITGVTPGKYSRIIQEHSPIND